MKLVVNNAFKLGHVSVRGGRLLRVLTEHAVPSVGSDIRRNKLGDVPWAQPRDLALEILSKNGTVLGYSYLSGPAIGMNRYTPTGPGWFESESAVLKRVSFSPPTESEIREKGGMDGFYEREIKAAMTIKYGGADAVVFRGMVASEKGDMEFASSILEHVLRIWSYAPDERGQGAHLFAVTLAGKKVVAVGHWQPREHASSESITGFQHELLWDAWQRSTEEKNDEIF